MKGITFKSSILFSLVLSLLVFYILCPRATVVEELEDQLALLEKRGRNYRKRGNELVSLKIEQLLFLLRPSGRAQETRYEAIIERESRFYDDSSFQDHRRAESIVAEEIRAIGEPLLTRLFLVLESEPGHEGFACVLLRVLSKMSLRRFNQCLGHVLQGAKNNVFTREAVVQSLHCEGTGFEDELLELARNWKNWGRQYPIYVLRKLECKRAMPVFCEALKDSSPAVRRHSAMALAELGDGSALAPLRAMLAQEEDLLSENLARAAIRAIRQRLPSLEGEVSAEPH